MEMKKRYTFRREIYLGLAIGAVPLGIAAVLYSAGFYYEAYGVGVIGMLLLGYHHTIKVNYITNEAVYQKTIYGFPLYTKIKIKTDSLCCVEQVLEVRVRSDESMTSDKVYVTYLSGTKKLKIKEHGDLSASRQFSERLSQSMGLAFHDHTAGAVRVREPSEVNMSLGELLRKRGENLSYPSVPMHEDLSVDRSAGVTILRFAPQPYEWYAYAIVVMVFTVFVAALWFFVISHKEVDGGVFWFIVSVVSAFLVKVIVSSHQPGYLQLDKYGIRVKRMAWKKKMGFDELEELACDGRDITVIGDKERFMLPYDFYDDALSEFVLNLIEYHAMKSYQTEQRIARME